jgi:hypothetical protein
MISIPALTLAHGSGSGSIIFSCHTVLLFNFNLLFAPFAFKEYALRFFIYLA